MRVNRRFVLGWLAGAAAGASGATEAAGAASASTASARTAGALMLAREAPPDVDPAGYLVSEKYDGARALWDGTALRFRSGLPVHAPAWFLARLPRQPLDGELWLGRGRFDALAATVRRQAPLDAEWQQVRYQVFDLPGAGTSFASRAAKMEQIASSLAWPQLVAVAQSRIADRAALAHRLDAVVRAGGEGLVLHRADALWLPGRSTALLKLKPLNDADAIVVGQVAGRGKHAGRMGALRLRRDDGAEFLVGSGFTDAQREHPPALGSAVTYTHRGSTGSGLPRFASFLRERTV